MRSLRDVRARLNDLRRQLDEIERDAQAAYGERADRASGSFMSALRKLNRHSLS